LNAAKIERIFAKPFVASLEGHSDAVEVLVRKPKSLSTVASASWNGGVYVACVFFAPVSLSFSAPLKLDHSGIAVETGVLLDIIIHDLQQRTEVLTLRGAHKGKASGLCFGGENGDRFLSCGVDKTVKLWNTPTGLEQDTGVRPIPLHTSCCFNLPNLNRYRKGCHTTECVPVEKCIQVRGNFRLPTGTRY
jgi:WD repeat and SOF domain-containing protein 1